MVDAAAWGVEPGYHAHAGQWIEPPRETVDALLDCMGAHDERPPDVADLRFARPGEALEPGPRWELLTEDGGSATLDDGTLPPDTPLGYHRLRTDDRELALVVSPGRCHLPEGLKTWGW